MPTQYNIIIRGNPKGKGAARHFSIGNRVIAATPKETVILMNEIRRAWTTKNYPFFEKGIPLKISMSAVFEIPASTSKKAKEKMLTFQIYPTKKPDGDNLLKLLDGLNGVAWHDDAQIVESTITKIYGPMPYTSITVEEIINEANKE